MSNQFPFFPSRITAATALAFLGVGCASAQQPTQKVAEIGPKVGD